MKTFPANFTSHKNRTDGAHPVWILQLTILSMDFFLSDNAFIIPGFGTTLPLIKSWGKVLEGISVALGEFHVADFSVEILIDQASSPNMEEFATVGWLDHAPAALYQWFHGCTDPPQRIFTGFVDDLIDLSDTSFGLSMQDETILLEKTYVGTKIDRATYPNADPDAIGRIIPVVFGTVTKLPAVCVDSGWVTSTTGDIGVADTVINVTDLPVSGSATNKTFTLGDEQLFVTAGTTRALTVTRGYNSTIPTGHSKGTVVVEKKATPLIYLCGDRALANIGTIVARVKGVDVDITSACTKYVGTPGNQLAAYPGKAAITISNIPLVQKRISLVLAGGVAFSDPGHSHNAGNNVVTANATQSASGTGTTNGDCVFLWDAVHNLSNSPSSQNAGARIVSFPDPGGTITACTMSATVNVYVPATGGYWYLMCGGLRITSVFSNSITGYSPAITHDATSRQGNDLMLVVGANSTGQNAALTAYAGGTITSSSRTITYTTTQSVTIADAPSGVSISDTLALTGNSVADVMVGDTILVNVTGTITSPSAVIAHLLSVYGGIAAFQLIGAVPASYAFNGAITTYEPLLKIINSLAFQARAWFAMANGTARMIMRPASGAVTNIPTCIVGDDGRRMLTRNRTAITDVITKITVLYNRDWSQNKSATAYTASVIVPGATGTEERPELFQFDFVTDQTMAADVGAFYLAEYTDRHWQAVFPQLLHHSDLEFGDRVTLGFLGGVAGTVINAGQAPGSSEAADTIELTVIY